MQERFNVSQLLVTETYQLFLEVTLIKRSRIHPVKLLVLITINGFGFHGSTEQLPLERVTKWVLTPL